MVEKETKISRIISQENCDDIIEKDKENIALAIEDIKNNPQLSPKEKEDYIKKLRIELGKDNNLIK